MSCYPSLETHPLKVLRSTENINSQKVVLGPPDVYQQEPKQKEDLLSEFNVREGFNCTKVVADEHESGKDIGVDFVSRSFQIELNSYMQAVIVKNHNNNIKPDTTKRKVAVTAMFKDLQCIPAIEKSKEITNEWVVGLCDTVPYAELINKRIPYFHKKDDVLKEMNRYQVPITRAIWFIKVSAMLATIQAESNKKKSRSSVDSSSDWVAVLIRVLNEKLELVAAKLVANSLDHEYELTIIEFEYLIRLLVAMYDEDLLDHSEILQWLVGRCKRMDESLMQFYLPFLLQFGDRFKESEILTRKLLYWACDMINSLLSEEKFGAHRSLTDYYSEYSNCAMHRNVLFCLSGIITSLSLLCPSAVVWNNVKAADHYLHGSPLDSLPCSLTALPSPPGPENDTIRDTLAKLEQFVMQRSLLVENQWQHESFNSDVEHTANSLIHILDLLDRYDFNYCKEQNAMEMLTGNLLSALDNIPMLLLLLCEWSTTLIRTGLHRPIIAVHVIEHLRHKSEHSFQSTLVQFLDTKAPFIDCPATVESEQFRNLICLFGELIEREIFSIDEYVSYMIKRGIFECCGQLPLPAIGGPLLANVARSPDVDRNSVDNPDSVRSECSGLNQPHPVMSTIDYRPLNRHVQYLIHFPIPNNEDYQHEHNLRAQKLYWSTKTRESNKQFIKRLIKDVARFFNKRSNMFDVIQMERARKKPRKDARDESLLLDKLADSVLFRFKSLTYYDQELVMSQCLSSLVNSFNLAAILANKNQSMSNLYLPYPKMINTLLSMIEYSCNYTSLIQTIEECLFNLSKLIEHLSRHAVLTHGSYLATYCSNYRINIIGFLARYQSVVMLLYESRHRIFHALFFMLTSQALSVANTPSYVNRCTYGLIHTIYQSCAIIKSQRTFAQFGKKMIRVVEPDRVRSANIVYDDTFAHDLIRGNAMPSTERYTAIIHDMQNNSTARLSFVVNCVLHVSRCPDTDQLIRINTMIVETTANVTALPVEWMTALFSLLMPFNALPGYAPFKEHFTALLTGNDTTVFYDNIAVLIATLLARQTFTFCDFLSRVICVSMAQGLEQLSPVSAEIVPTTRLASYILHRLFTTDSVTPAFANIGAFKLEDINLLTSALQKVTTELLVDLLKMLAVHSDKGRLHESDCFVDPPAKRPREQQQQQQQQQHQTDVDDNFHSMRIWNLTLRVLREICGVSWVRIKFSMETPSRLIRENVLIDKNISNSQARNLLNIIFQPKDYVWQASNTSKDIIDTMDRTFEHINLWSLHFDQMKIQLLLTQIPDDERKEIIDIVSRDTINLFQLQAEQQLHKQDWFDDGASASVSVEINSSYLIPPLINKLPFDNLKRQLIQAAAERLESGKHFATHKNSQDKEKDLTKSSLILTYPPFISLLVFCLTRDDNKHEFLKSLSDQIEYYIDNAKETEKMPDDLRVKHLIHTSLKSRLALVGYLFDRIQDSLELSSDWSLLLSKLIIHGVVEMQSDHTQLFYTVLDMIGTLIHTLIAQQNISTRLIQVCKKLRKEIADKSNYEGVELIKPFLFPCIKNTYDVVITVPLRMPHKSQQFRLTSSEKSGKHGCAIQKKERLNPWEVIEGVKNLFSMSWFAAVSCDTPVLPIEEQANLMIGHDHSDKMIRNESYYTAMPDIPAEDIKDVCTAADMAMEFVSSNGPPSVTNSVTDNMPLNIGGNNPGSVKIENSLMQPLQRSHSNASTASSEVSSSKRTKRAKRSAAPAANHAMSRSVTSPVLMTGGGGGGNPAMMIRHPGLPSNNAMPMYPHQYTPHTLDYANYAPHQIAMIDMQQQHQQQSFMQRAPYPPTGYEHQRTLPATAANAASVNIMRPNRMPRSNVVTQILKTKIQQRQPQPDNNTTSMHPSFHNTGPGQMPCLPPPYPGSANTSVIDDMVGSTAAGQQVNYGNNAVMANYQLQRQYPDSSVQQFLLQQQHHQQQQQQQQQQQSRIQQSRMHQQQYDRPF